MSPMSVLLLLLLLTGSVISLAPTYFKRVSCPVGGERASIVTSLDDDESSGRARRQRRRPRRSAGDEESKSTTSVIEADDEGDEKKEVFSSMTPAITSNEHTPSSSSSSSSCSSPASLRQLVDDDDDEIIAVIIDVENVRGKTGFELDHADLLDRLLVWTSMRGNIARGRTIAVIDHGSRSGAHILRGEVVNRRRGGGGGGDDGGSDHGPSLCVSFAGPRIKADDVIARDVRWLLSSSSSSSSCSHERRRWRRVVAVVTADRELAWRCRCAAATAARLTCHSTVNVDDDVGEVSSDPVVVAARERCGGRKKKSRAKRIRRFAEQRTEQDREGGEEGWVTSSSMGDVDDGIMNATTMGSGVVVVVNDSPLDAVIAGGIPAVEVISPQRFLEDLDLAVHEWLRWREPNHVGDGYDAMSTTMMPMTTSHEYYMTTAMPSQVTTTRDLFRLRGRMLTLESSLRGKISLHRRGQTMGELRKCKVEWRKVLSSIVDGGGRVIDGRSLLSSLAWSLSFTISSLDENDGCGDDPNSSPLPSLSTTARGVTSSWERLAPKDQERLLLQWRREGPRGQRRQNAARREKTEDRVVLAERLRRQLELIFDRSGEDERFDDADEEIEATLVDMYARYINNACRRHCSEDAVA